MISVGSRSMHTNPCKLIHAQSQPSILNTTQRGSGTSSAVHSENTYVRICLDDGKTKDSKYMGGGIFNWINEVYSLLPGAMTKRENMLGLVYYGDFCSDVWWDFQTIFYIKKVCSQSPLFPFFLGGGVIPTPGFCGILWAIP